MDSHLKAHYVYIISKKKHTKKNKLDDMIA